MVAMKMNPVVCAQKNAATPKSVPKLSFPKQNAVLYLAGTIASAAIVATTPSSLAADLDLGQQVFDGNCAACHMGGNNSVQNEKTLRKAALEQYLDGGFNIDAIQYQVINGKNAMPAWGDRLDPDEIESVAAYVYDQASGDKW